MDSLYGGMHVQIDRRALQPHEVPGVSILLPHILACIIHLGASQARQRKDQLYRGGHAVAHGPSFHQRAVCRPQGGVLVHLQALAVLVGDLPGQSLIEVAGDRHLAHDLLRDAIHHPLGGLQCLGIASRHLKV